MDGPKQQRPLMRGGSVVAKTILIFFLFVMAAPATRAADAQEELPAACQMEAPRQSGLDIVLMLDNSDSVVGTYDRDGFRFRATRFLVEYLLADGLTRGVQHRITVWVFGDEVRLLSGWENLDADPTDGRTFQDIIREADEAPRLRGTNFAGALKKAGELFQARPDCTNQPVLFVLSDMKPDDVSESSTSAIQQAVREALDAWQLQVAGGDPIPVYLLAIDANGRYPFNEYWSKHFYGPLAEKPAKGQVAALEPETMLDLLVDVFRGLPITYDVSRPTTDGDKITLRPYLDRAVFTFVDAKGNPGHIRVEAESGHDTAGEAVRGEFISVYDVPFPRETRWQVTLSVGQAWMLVGEEQPRLDIRFDSECPVVAGQHVRLTAQLPDPEQRNPNVNVQLTWKNADQLSGWLALRPLGREGDIYSWQLTTMPEEEFEYDLVFSAKGVASDESVVADVECRIPAVVVPGMSSVEPCQFVTGERTSVRVTVNRVHKMGQLEPSISFLRTDGTECLPRMRPEPADRGSSDIEFLFSDIPVPTDGDCRLQVELAGKTTDGVLVSQRSTCYPVTPTPHPAPSSTPCSVFPTPKPTPEPIPCPQCPRLPIRARLTVFVPIVLLFAVATLITRKYVV